jgi:diadenosine tetraphosphate (Ap4A) HIT family hydrolase
MPPDSCTACLGQWPPADHRIGDCGLTTAYLFEDQFFPGWTVLVLNRHATELFQLSPDERSRLIEEVSRVAHTLAGFFQAVKINYELLGNQLPHVHWHLIPRLAGDPAPTEPVWRVPHEPKRLAPQELRERIEALQARLGL